MLPPRPRTSVDPDDAIRATDDDAAASRLSAINLGYLDDPYTSLLYRPRASLTDSGAGSGNGNGGAGPSTSAAAARKPPLINVGTYLRTRGIDHLVDQFLEAAGEEGGQIVSLGAGSDSRFWKLRSHARSNRIRKYIEIDFPHVTSLKAQRIARSPKLSKLLSTHSDILPTIRAEARSEMAPPSGPSIPPKPYSIGKGGTSLLSPTYSLIPLDLRASPAAQLEDEILPLLDPNLPTLFLAECVFCYMSPKLSEEVVQWFGKTFDGVVGVVYEMCGLNDTFGQVMKRNLASRQLSLPGSEPFASPADQAQRFLVDSLGEGKFTRSGAKNLWEVRQGVIPPEELRRIAQLEFLDEVEELKLVLEHYCIAWGSKGPGLEGVGLGI